MLLVNILISESLQSKMLIFNSVFINMLTHLAFMYVFTISYLLCLWASGILLILKCIIDILLWHRTYWSLFIL